MIEGILSNEFPADSLLESAAKQLNDLFDACGRQITRCCFFPFTMNRLCFLELLNKGAPCFDLTLRYRGEKLIQATLNGVDMMTDGMNEGRM